GRGPESQGAPRRRPAARGDGGRGRVATEWSLRPPGAPADPRLPRDRGPAPGRRTAAPRPPGGRPLPGRETGSPVTLLSPSECSCRLSRTTTHYSYAGYDHYPAPA